MFQFANYSLLLLIAALFAAPIISRLRFVRRNRALTQFADRQILCAIFPDIKGERRLAIIHAIYLAMLLVLLTATLFRPQFGFTLKEGAVRGVDIVLAVDVSDSMLVQDVKPSRLERARREVLDLLSLLQGDRLALVAFAGTAFVQVPLTHDYSTIKLFLDALEPELIPVKGSSLKLAFDKSLSAFGLSKDSQRSSRERALIIVTDGGDGGSKIDEIRQTAQAYGVRIYVIGVGTAEGGPIPTGSGFKRDRRGQQVVSSLNENELISLATATGGIYVQSIATTEDIVAIYHQGIKQVFSGSDIKTSQKKVWNEYFQFPLLAALLLLLARQLVVLRRGHYLFPLALYLMFSSSVCQAQDTPKEQGSKSHLFSELFSRSERLGESAREDYLKGNFTAALDKFSRAATRSSEDPRFELGKGATAYRLGDFESAYQSFAKAAEQSTAPAERAKAVYNTGNSLVQLGKLKEAINSYQESLKLVPDDPDAKSNLELAKKLLEEQKQQQNQQQGSSDQREGHNQEAGNSQNNGGGESTSDNETREQQGNDANNSGSNSTQPEGSESNPNPGPTTQETDESHPLSQDQTSTDQEDNSGPLNKGDSSESASQNNNTQSESLQPAIDNGGRGLKDLQQQNGGSTKSDNTSAGAKLNEEKGDQVANQVESLLDDVQEQSSPVANYRAKMAKRDLAAGKQKPPENDW